VTSKQITIRSDSGGALLITRGPRPRLILQTPYADDRDMSPPPGGLGALLETSLGSILETLDELTSQAKEARQETTGRDIAEGRREPRMLELDIATT